MKQTTEWIAGRTFSLRRFTLIELLIVIAVIAVLAGMLLSALSKAKAVTYRSTCANQQKQILLALTLYADTYRSFPILGWNDGIGNRYWHSMIEKMLDPKKESINSPIFHCPSHKLTRNFISYAPNGHLMPTYAFGQKTHFRERINFQNLTLPQRTAALLDSIRGDTAGSCFTGNSNGLSYITIENNNCAVASRHEKMTVIVYADMHASVVRLPTILGALIPKDILYYWKPDGSPWLYAK